MLEDTVTVSVDGDGEPVVRHEITQQPEVALGILLLAEDRTEDVAGGIVDGREKGEAWAAVLQPGVRAPIEKDEQASLEHALPALAMARRSPPARTTEPGREEDAAHGGQGECEPLRAQSGAR